MQFICRLLICLLFLGEVQADLQELLLATSEALLNRDNVAPNPLTLKPKWWNYFMVEGDELLQRIHMTSQNLEALYLTLPAIEQEKALKYINNINANLYAYAVAKQHDVQEKPIESVFLKAYTLEQQLAINHRIRKLSIELKEEDDEYEKIKKQIFKADKYIDNLMINYLGTNKPSVQKFFLGLDIIARRSAMGIAEQRNALLKNNIAHHQAGLAHLNRELDVAKEALDLQTFDESQILADISVAQEKYTEAQTSVVKAEASIFDVLHGTSRERSMHHLHDEQVLYAYIYQDVAWANLAFAMLKYNLFMSTTGRFHDNFQLLRNEQEQWKEKLEQIIGLIKEWRVAALREQEALHKEMGILAVQETLDAKLYELNQSRREENNNTLTTLQLLEEKLLDVRWLIELVDLDIKSKSSFIERFRASIEHYLVQLGKLMNRWGHSSLFKLGGFPITFFMLLKIAFILLVTIYSSKFINAIILPLAKSRGKFSDSNLYNSSRLIHYCILSLGLLIALVSIGMDSSNLFILAGALAFGIGFGFQSVANNIFCGIRILFERKIKIGDYVILESGEKGKVSEIQLQHTVVTTSDGVDVIVPNSELIDKTLINMTMNNDYCRLRIPFFTANHCDKELVRTAVAAAALRVPCTIYNHPDFSNPQVWLVKFGDNTLHFELVVWVDLRLASNSDSREADYIWEIETAFREHKIPMPVNELYLQRKARFLENSLRN